MGKGDCTIIEHPSGHITMVDINNSKALDEESMEEIATNIVGWSNDVYIFSKAIGTLNEVLKAYTIDLVDPIEYFKQKIINQTIFRFICTHPDMDHLSGIYRLRQEVLRNNINFLNFWDTKVDFQKGDFADSPYDENDWNEYLKLHNGDKSETILKLNRGASNKYYNQDDSGGTGDGLYILAPTPKLEQFAQLNDSTNDVSYVLMLIYGSCRIMLGGDAGDSTWESIFNYFDENKLSMSVSVLKASHHGRRNGYHQPSVKEMAPTYTIVSTGQKDKHDASQLYNQYSTEILSTRWWGNIIAKCSYNGLTQIFTEKNRRNSQTTDPLTGYWLLPPRPLQFLYDMITKS